jgi:hypothetical protein
MMVLARCTYCRNVLSAEDPVCPHCQAKHPIGLTREDDWASARDPMRLDPDGSKPFRLGWGATFLLILVVVLLVFCAATRTGV